MSGQGVGTFSYQWYQIPSGGTTGVAIPGAISTSYVALPVDFSYDGAQIRLQSPSSCAAMTRADALLEVTAGNVPPTILTQPAGQAVPAGGTTSFTVTASGTPALSYQWYLIAPGQKMAHGGQRGYLLHVFRTRYRDHTWQRSGSVLRHSHQFLWPSGFATRDARRWQRHLASDYWSAGHTVCGRWRTG